MGDNPSYERGGAWGGRVHTSLYVFMLVREQIYSETVHFFSWHVSAGWDGASSSLWTYVKTNTKQRRTFTHPWGLWLLLLTFRGFELAPPTVSIGLKFGRQTLQGPKCWGKIFYDDPTSSSWDIGIYVIFGVRGLEEVDFAYIGGNMGSHGKKNIFRWGGPA